MTNFKRQFIYAFFERLLVIISNERLLLKACQDFQNGHNDERYLCRTAFGLEAWAVDDAGKFSAAVAEALGQTTVQFQAVDDKKLKLIQACSETLKNTLIPELTANVNNNNPMIELRQKIREKMQQIVAEEAVFNNPYTLFGGIAAVAIVATVTAWTLAQPK